MDRFVALVARPFASAITVFLLSFAWLGQVSPWLGIYQNGADEGLNLGKAALVAAGYGPYGEMWNDQGPVLTYLLAAFQFVSANDVYAARLLVIAMASLLLAGLYAAVHRDGGRLAAAIVVILLATTPFFVRLSSAVMIGLPAVGLAVLALAAANARSPHAALRAAVSGVLFGLSLQTKLFTFTMFPALLIAGGLGAENAGRKAHRLAAIWVIAGALAFGIVVAISGQSPVENLVETHIAPELRATYAFSTSFAVIRSTLLQMPAVLIPGLLGLLALPFMSGMQARSLLIPAIWFATAFLALSVHQPVQPHQVLLLVVPLAWIGGIFIARLDAILSAGPRSIGQVAPAVPVVVAACAAAYGISTLPGRATLAVPQPQELSALAVEAYAPFGGWVVVDQPLAAFRNGLLVPPELVVFSEKRRNTGSLTDGELLASIERRRPSQVVFQRFPAPQSLSARLADSYVVAHRGVSAPPYIQYVTRNPDVSLDRTALSRRLADLIATMAATNVGGGYAAAVDPATGDRFGEGGKRIGPDMIWMRPPGATYQVGQRFLRAYAATAEDRYRDLALGAALAVARSRSCRGGWPAAAERATGCTSGSAGSPEKEDFDEGMQAGAIAFMLEVAAAFPDAPQSAELMRASREGLAFLLATQNEQGAWPGVGFTTSDYRKFSALGDDVTTSHIRVLLQAYEVFADEHYLAAARRGLDFLVAAQLQSGGWGQQYDTGLRPVAGRSFEPAAADSIVTASVVATMIEGRVWFPDPRLLSAAARAQQWLTASQIGPENWARFYQIGTNRPIFGDRDGSVHYSLDEVSEERRNGYDWMGRFPAVIDAIRLAQAARDGDASFAAEKSAIAEAGRLARLARALGKDADNASAGAPDRTPLLTERWMATVDDLLVQIEFASRPIAARSTIVGPP